MSGDMAPELDGEPVPIADLTALALHNYGHFTTMRVVDLRVRGLAAHLRRLVRDARVLFDADLDTDRVRELVRRAAAGDSPCVVRVTVFAPDLDIAAPAAAAGPRVLVSRRSAPGVSAPPPVRLGSVRYRRELPAVKHVGLFGPIRHRRAVQRSGYDDALFVTDPGGVAEGPTWNVGFFDGTRVVWPTAEHLPGVTMGLVAAALDRAGIPSVSMPVGLEDLGDLRTAFTTNAVVGLRRIASVDGRPIRDDPDFLAAARAAYSADPGDPL